MKEKIGLVKSRQQYQGSKEALSLLEERLAPLAKKAEKPVIKINFVSISNELAVTPVDSVRAVIDILRKYCDKEITIAEEAVLGGSTAEGWKRFGYQELVEDYFGIKLLDIKEGESRYIDLGVSGGGSFSLPFSKTMIESDLLVSVTRPKTHDTVVATLTGKNIAVGGISGLENKSRVHKGKSIHSLLLSILERCPPHICLLDGTVGMEGQGPNNGSPIDSGWVAAGFDWLAIDTLGAYLMGFDIENIGYLSLAKGGKYPDGVEIIGQHPEILRKEFKPHSGYQQQIEWR